MTATFLLRRCLPIATLCFLISISFSSVQIGAQDSDATKAAVTNEADDDSGEAAAKPEEEKEEDPFAVPEGATAEELLAFIRKVKTTRGRTLEAVSKAANAAASAADAIRKLDGVSTENEMAAVREQLAALSFLQRYRPASRQDLQDLLSSLMEDERPEFKKIGVIEDFKSRIGLAARASKQEQVQLVDELKELIGEGEFDRDAYTLAYTLARSISSSDSTELAASLYEDMAARMSKSSDASLQERAPKMLGAARRIRLPGNPMEIVGTTTTGENFDWAAYRGKVVLVDFWASWCGPCRAEIPNMKRNLELYGEKGFAIVGVNLDNTLEACEKYVEEEGLTWTNLMSSKEGEQGWNNPLANYYGITGIPTAILVDQKGNVVSLSARGKNLDNLLVELLGEVEPKDADSSDDQENATEAQGENNE